MKLDTAQRKVTYIIKNILSTDEEITSRFYKLGIFPGVAIQLMRKAPIFSDPLLFDVEGAQIALTKAEASFLEADVQEADLCQQ